MCGIFGIVTNNKEILQKHTQPIFTDMMKLSASRGKEATGVALSHDGRIEILKAPIAAQNMIRLEDYCSLFASLKNSHHEQMAILGHCRLVTNGSQLSNQNNQPIVFKGVLGIHNGIIVNDNSIWNKYPQLSRNAEVDTEVIMALISRYLSTTNSIAHAIRSTFLEIEGAASIAVLFQQINQMVIATNTGSLYTYKYNDVFLFASERYIMQQLISHWKMLRNDHYDDKIRHVSPNSGVVVDIATVDEQPFIFDSSYEDRVQHRSHEWTLKTKVLPIDICASDFAVGMPKTYNSSSIVEFRNVYQNAKLAVSNLKRCTCCVLPETIPFIQFDDAGICNYCREYVRTPLLSRKKLEEEIAYHRRRDGRPDCLVMLSGGRDSSYGLHYVKKELGMNPVAFTFDWGMITDIARRNASRMCAKLGIEQILLSADIRHKRENIRTNIQAWLKRPELGMVPLFMAGDKQFFYYANQVKKQLGIDIVFYLTNRRFEKTLFKSGFCGVYEGVNDSGTYYLNIHKKLQLLWYHAREIFINPRYLNRTLFDTLFGFYSAYISNHNMLQLYRYILWDEKEIEQTLASYNWEVASDTGSTWRIGDGTAAFYNYIYYIMAGFTENDTMRSNQIREGVIDRKSALALIEIENEPRYESIQWYAHVIGFDFEEAIRVINRAPRLYKSA